MDAPSERADWDTAAALIWRIRVGLLTTVDLRGHFHSRPLQTLQVESDQTLWFFTDWSSSKVDELQSNPQVSLGYAEPAQHTFVVVNGVARVMRDPQKAKQLWSAEQLTFFPEGPEDPRLALLRVEMQRAEYWLAPGRVSYLLAAARAAITGEPVGVLGENHTVS